MITIQKEFQTLKFFFRNCNCKDIDFPATSKDWRKFEQNNKTIALNILFVPHNTEKIELPYKSKYNLKPKNELILLMITGGEKWHYLAVKNLPALLKGKTSNHKGGFYSLIFFFIHTAQKINLKDMKEYVMIMITVK